MSASEIIEQIDHLPMEDQKAIFVFLTKKVIGGESGSKRWLGKNLSFEEACDVVFRENRELLSALAK
jgi:hypothetical protein